MFLVVRILPGHISRMPRRFDVLSIAGGRVTKRVASWAESDVTEVCLVRNLVDSQWLARRLVCGVFVLVGRSVRVNPCVWNSLAFVMCDMACVCLSLTVVPISFMPGVCFRFIVVFIFLPNPFVIMASRRVWREAVRL